MADEKLEGPQLKKMIKLGKKQTLNFAFCPGKSKGDHVLMISRRKAPSKLAVSARNESSGTRVAFGTLDVSGKDVELTCEKVVSNLAKTLKTYLRGQKLQVNVVVKDGDGNELERDVEDLPPDPEFDNDDADDAALAADDADDGARTDDATDDDASDDGNASAAQLAARLKAIQPQLGSVPQEARAKLQKVVAGAVALIKSGNLEKADQAITTLEAAITKMSASAAASNSAEEGKPDVKDLVARANELKSRISATAHPARDKLLAALGEAAKKIKASDVASADGMLTTIEAALQKTQAASDTGESPEAAKWETSEAKLQPLVDNAMQAGRGDLDAINRAFNYAKELAEAGDYGRALAAAGKVAELLKAAQTATTTAAAAEAQASAPDDVVAYVQSRLAWINTRAGMKKELEELKAAIDAVTADIEGLEDVPSKSAKLFDYLEDIDTELEDTLEKLVETPDGDDRETLKVEAQKIIEKYKSVLDTPFFQAVDDNGFTKATIRSAAVASLDSVSSALAT